MSLAALPRPAPPQTSTRTWPLRDGGAVQITLPLRPTRRDIAQLRRYLDTLEVEASIAWQDDPPTDDAPSVG